MGTNSVVISSSLSLTSSSYIHHQNNNNNNNNNKFYFPLYSVNNHQSESNESSPFQPCIDKLWEMSYCHTPTKKLECLVELQQLVIKCIDQYRQNQFNKNNNNNCDNQKEEKLKNDKQEKQQKQEEKVNNDRDDDDDDDGISIESLDYVSDDFDDN